MLLSDLGTFLSRRGQANSGELLFWFAFFRVCWMALMSIFPVFAHQVQSNPTHTRGLCRYHRQFWEAAEAYFLTDSETAAAETAAAEACILKNSEMRKERHCQLALFFNRHWEGKEKPYTDAL